MFIGYIGWMPEKLLSTSQLNIVNAEENVYKASVS